MTHRPFLLPTLPVALGILLLGLATSSLADDALYDSNIDGLEVIVDSGLTATDEEAPPESDGNKTLLIEGNPENDYSKFFNPASKGIGNRSGTLLLPIPSSAHGKRYVLSFEVYLPSDSQIDKTSAMFQFFRDPEADCSINDAASESGDDRQKVQLYHYDMVSLSPAQANKWQKAEVSGTIPALDEGKEPIGAVRFSIGFRQVNAPTNNEPIKAYVRNIKLVIE